MYVSNKLPSCEKCAYFRESPAFESGTKAAILLGICVSHKIKKDVPAPQFAATHRRFETREAIAMGVCGTPGRWYVANQPRQRKPKKFVTR